MVIAVGVLAGCGTRPGTAGPALPSAAGSGPPSSPAAARTPGLATPGASIASGVVVTACASPVALSLREYKVPAGSHPHDVSPATDGGIWYTAQQNGILGHLDPATGDVREIPLGAGSAPHGVITGPDGAAWITDGGLNAIVRVDPATDAVRVFRLPQGRGGANLNTAVFDASGLLWFTGQSGIYGRLDPATGEMTVWDAPRGRGPYGITATPDGSIWYASLGGQPHRPHRPGDRRAPRSSSRRPRARAPGASGRTRTGRLWVSEWNAGQVAVHDPADNTWREWRLPGTDPDGLRGVRRRSRRGRG